MEGPATKHRKTEADVDEREREEAKRYVGAAWVLAKPTLLQNAVTGEWAMHVGGDRVVFGGAGGKNSVVSVEREPGGSAEIWQRVVSAASSGETPSFLGAVRLAEAIQTVAEAAATATATEMLN